MSNTSALAVLDGAVPRLGVTLTDRPATDGKSPSIKSPKPSSPPTTSPERLRFTRLKPESQAASLVSSKASSRPKLSRNVASDGSAGIDANTRFASTAHAARSRIKETSNPGVPGTQPSHRTIRSSSDQESRCSRSNPASAESAWRLPSMALMKVPPRPLRLPAGQTEPEGRPRMAERSIEFSEASTSVTPRTSPSVRPSQGISMFQSPDVTK